MSGEEQCDNSFQAATGFDTMGSSFGMNGHEFMMQQAGFLAAAAGSEVTPAAAAAAEAGGEVASAEDEAFKNTVRSLETRSLASHARLNSAAPDEHNFYTAEVSMYFESSLADLASGKKEPVLKLSKECRAFERPGQLAKGAERSQLHFQGDIDLVSFRSTFPVSVCLVADSKLRGAENATVHSGSGVKCSFLSFPEQKESFRTSPYRIAHASLGFHDREYMSKYPDYLDPKAIQDSIMVSPFFGANTMCVKIGSPVFDAIQENRQKMREAGDANVTDLDTTSDFAKSSGYTLAGKAEAGKAALWMQKVVASKIKYVNLYEALKFNLVRGFTQQSESGVLDEKAAWADLAEKKSQDAATEQSEAGDKYMNRVRTIHASFLVRYRPVQADEQKK